MDEINGIVYTPSEAANLTAKLVKSLKTDALKDGIKTGISDIDKFMLPMLPSELCVVLAYTSHGKTSWMNWLARQAISQCAENEIVIKCTWEQSVEEDTLYWIANDSGIPITTMVKGVADSDWVTFMKSYSKRATTPLWIVGHSSIQSQQTKKIRPRLTMSNVTQACEFIMTKATDSEFKVKMLVLDYLQRIRPDASDGDNRRIQMMEAVNKAKDLAIALGCPVVLGVQSSRDVLDREYKMPRIDDGQETSNIEQSAQKVMALWYPIKTEKENKKVDGNLVTEHLMMFSLLKQTLGAAPVTVPLYFDPASNRFGNIAKFGGP